MSRDWLAVYTATIGRPKYRRLSIPARAALFHVWLLAPSQTPEATWRDRAELLELLELDGYTADLPAELFDQRPGRVPLPSAPCSGSPARRDPASLGVASHPDSDHLPTLSGLRSAVWVSRARRRARELGL